MLGDLLRSQMLLDGDRIIGAAFDGGIVRDDHAIDAGDRADAGDDSGGRRRVAVHAVRRERREFEERRRRVDQPVDAIARRELAALAMAFHDGRAAAGVGAGECDAQVLDERRHCRRIACKTAGAVVDATLQYTHSRGDLYARDGRNRFPRGRRHRLLSSTARKGSPDLDDIYTNGMDEARPYFICGIGELHAAPLAAARRVVSILDPAAPVPPELAGLRAELLTLRFDDVIEPTGTYRPPAVADIERLLAFDRDPRAHGSLVIHCTAGISRSTAAFAIVLAQRRPGHRGRDFRRAARRAARRGPIR